MSGLAIEEMPMEWGLRDPIGLSIPKRDNCYSVNISAVQRGLLEVFGIVSRYMGRRCWSYRRLCLRVIRVVSFRQE